ncbi:MAG: hypothetical protein UX91_C0009G0027 [Candidatus Amesbacteria bacterium GW2011_GWB1_47_19]|nr:MAG: hypothetical protein UW51_C0008G0029 [Candidatus Amesbacteria bacterium GW2011_GWA1_44_24]KKU30958.1 MAG: Mannose-1-phosphate guanylyltransferase [Candidatus Amesbacteria bacterium GW2011_GWC1_46_24]KKU66621.1 MAG: hypothetical protein UX91_C0009G0027 [Candidatus Amesbacteria bacterium GW2011_GWB1_47_19]OGD05342.1 MAG: hypothetical protein A2379_01300 [Candidatus Amesbacteria bacterium RIFOXYB1_FULL_47_13]HBC73203.1 mannose-1-phosphate guanylyltransferase [Candidatus Amesbacteria bacter
MEEVQKHTYVLILAGGGGTRLWPQSRESFPKQFVKLFSGKSLFSLTLARAKKIVPSNHIFIATISQYQALVKKEAGSIPSENIFVEPIRRDTAIAHGLGAAYIYKQDPEAVIINLASDHLISPVDTFISQLKLAARTAYSSKYLVTVGIKPLFPHTGMGYIKASRTWSGEPGLLIGEKFVEKPPINIARRYISSGKYYWNANLYVFKAGLYLDLLKKFAPKSYTFFPQILNAIGTDNEKQIIRQAFQMAPTISIDFAVSEHLHKFICIPGKFNWSDVGDWNVVWQHLFKDKLGNVIEGPHGKGQYIGINSRNNILFLDKKIVATVGLNDMVIVDTPDALLICPKEDAQGVKLVVQTLKEQQLTKYL